MTKHRKNRKVQAIIRAEEEEVKAATKENKISISLQIVIKIIFKEEEAVGEGEVITRTSIKIIQEAISEIIMVIRDK